MKVIFHQQFYEVYASDPAATKRRLESIMDVIGPQVTLVEAVPASAEEIAVVHSTRHIDWVKQQGVYDMAALAAGGCHAGGGAWHEQALFRIDPSAGTTRISRFGLGILLLQ